MAALQLLHEYTDDILDNARLAFAQSDLGDSGETVAQLMCLLAVKKPSFPDPRTDKGFGDPDSINMMNTPLHEFLSKFFGKIKGPITKLRRSARFASATAAIAAENNDATKMSNLLRYFHVDCTAADIRLTHFKRVDRLPTLDELPFLFDIGAAVLLPVGNPGTDMAIVVRLVIAGAYRFSLIAIQVKNVAESISSASLKLLHDRMKINTVLRPLPTEPNEQGSADSHFDKSDEESLTAADFYQESGEESDEDCMTDSASRHSDETFVEVAPTEAAAPTAAPAKRPIYGLDLPFLRIVMKTRMSEAEQSYTDLCYLKLQSQDERDQGTGIVRGFPQWLTERQQQKLNEILLCYDLRSNLPGEVGDRELMEPWFASMHDSASERQRQAVERA